MSIDSALGIFAFTLDGHEPSTFQVRSMRTDLRQEGDVAAAWVTLRRRTPLAGAGVVERDWVEHIVLRRIGSSWRILSVAGSSVPRGSPRDPGSAIRAGLGRYRSPSCSTEADEAETTLAAVTDALRNGLGAERVRLWVRATGASRSARCAHRGRRCRR